MQLVHAEEAFRILKSDLDLRPIHHQVEKRVEAHIFVAFLGYCLTVTLRMKLKTAAPGLTPKEVLRCLSAIQMVDVHIPIADGRELVMPRYTEPEVQQQMILEKLKLTLPAQPPPRIRSGEVLLPERKPVAAGALPTCRPLPTKTETGHETSQDALPPKAETGP